MGFFLPAKRTIVIIGGNAAGPSAAAKAVRTNPDAEVILFEAGKFISTGTCELPYLISGDIKNYSDLLFFDAASFEKEKGAKIFINHLAERIDRNKLTVTVRDLENGVVKEQKYDKLILCTGSSAKKIIDIPDGTENVFYLKSVSDYLRIKKFTEEFQPQNILVIGSGYIGLESAEAFKKSGRNVTVIEKEKLPMPGAEPEASNLIKEILVKNGVEFIGGAGDLKFVINNNRIKAVKLDGRFVEFDLVLVSVGVEPNNQLAISAKLELGRSGGLKVDNKMRTSDSNIYAAGDNCEVISALTGKPEYLPLATLAHAQGHTAGDNAAGGNSYFDPFIKNIAVKVFDNSVVQVGLSSSEALCLRTFAVSAVVPNLVKVMPQSRNVFGKILINKNNKQIAGAVFVGGSETVGYGDLIASMIYSKTNAAALAKFSFNYTPPLSPFVNLLSVLGRKIEKEFL